MERLYLHTPEFTELWYLQKLFSDTDTMINNVQFDLPNSSCLSEEYWKSWYDHWINEVPLRYFRYIVRSSDGIFIGVVSFQKDINADLYDDFYNISIIIENQYRCNGYGRETLELSLDFAFSELGAASVQNRFDSYKQDVLKIHLYTGFNIRQEKHTCLASISKSKYLKKY